MDVEVFSGARSLGFFPLSEFLEETSGEEPSQVFDKAPFVRPANIRRTGQLLDSLDKGQEATVLFTSSVHDWFADRGNRVRKEGVDLIVTPDEYQEYQPSLEISYPVSLEMFTDYFQENFEDYDAAGNFLSLLDEKEQEFLETGDIFAGEDLSVSFSRENVAKFFALFLYNRYPFGYFHRKGSAVTFRRWEEVVFPEGRTAFLEKVEKLLSLLDEEEPVTKEQLPSSYWKVLDQIAMNGKRDFSPSDLVETTHDMKKNFELRAFLGDVLDTFRRPHLENIPVPRPSYTPLVEYVPFFVTKGDPIVLLHFGEKEDAWRIIRDEIRRITRDRRDASWDD